MTLRETLLAIADAFGTARGIGRQRVSTLVFNRGGRLDDIAAGGDVATGTYERAMAWFSENWPADAAWPEGIIRPSQPRSQPSAAQPSERGPVSVAGEGAGQ